MRKRALSFMMAGVLAAVSLTGCSGGGSTAESTAAQGQAGGTESKETTKAASAGETVIKVWTNDRHDSEYVDQKISEFNETNDKGIKIEMTVVTDDYANMLSMAYSSGTAPDIAGISAGQSGFDLKTFADARILEPLNERITDPDFEKVTQASKLQYEGIDMIDGNVYWIPTGMRSGVRMEYNKDLVEAAGVSEFPDTLDGVIDLAKKVTDNGGGKTYGVAFTSSVPFIRWIEGTSETSGIYRYDYQNGKFNFDGYKPVIEKCNQFFKDGSVLPGSVSQGVDAMRAQFAEGAFALWGNASQEAGVFTDQFPVTKFDWGVATVPTLDGEVKGALTIQPQKGYMMLSSSKNKEAAWEVIKFFSSEDFLKGYLEGGYCLPISDHMSGIIDSSKTGRLADFKLQDYESVYPAVPAVAIQGDDYVATLWNAISGNVSADEAIADLNKRYNEALDNDVSMGKIKRLIIKDFDPMNPNAGTIEYLDK
ncbi:extracellular solute-binding protein [Lachnospiraceae bacterium 54-53]